MSLRKLVEMQVKNAFKLVGDLKDDFTFYREITVFNSATLQNEVSNTAIATVKGLCFERKDRKGYVTELLIPSTSISTLEHYTSVSGLDKSWKIVPPIVNDGYLITLTLQEISNV